MGDHTGKTGKAGKAGEVREAVRLAGEQLTRAGVASPEHDAAELMAHTLGRTRGELLLVEGLTDGQQSEFEQLVARRARREPLHHITGTAAFRYVELAVGPGVFVPRPETELLAGWGIDRARAISATGRRPVVVDLCTGSGAMALAVWDESPDTDIHAVELSEDAYQWAARNLAGTGVDLRLGDMAGAFDELSGRVDVIVCNPPYIPLDAYLSVAPEARDFDPSMALWSGDDGLDAMRVLEAAGARLLRPGGVLGAEHADAQGSSAPAVFTATGRWSGVRDHADLAGRPRYLTATLAR